MKSIIFSICILFSFNFAFSQVIDTIYLWPNQVPGATLAKAPAILSDNTSKNVIRLAEVTNPLLLAYYPEKNTTNTSIIVCPGGGYHHLAINSEGTEVAEWLNQLGISAYVLIYRVPDNRDGALQDVQRAIRLLRQENKKYKIGVMGFSAGASLSARAATQFQIENYSSFDKADDLSSKPDFAGLLYPAYLDLGENRTLSPELIISENTPPLFIFGTADDKYGNSALAMTTAMRDNNRPVELHFLPEGGHGYGMRKGNIAAETWPLLYEKWLLNQIAE